MSYGSYSRRCDAPYTAQETYTAPEADSDGFLRGTLHNCHGLWRIIAHFQFISFFAKLRAKIQLKIQLCTCVREKFSQDKKTRLKFVFSVNNDYLCTHKNGKVLYGMLPSNPPGPDSSKGSWL